MYWLELLNESNYIEVSDFVKAHADASSLLKMIKSSILTTKQNNP